MKKIERNIAYPDVKLLSDLCTVKSQICSNRDGKSNTQIQKAMSPGDNKCRHVGEGSDSKNHINNSLKYYNMESKHERTSLTSYFHMTAETLRKILLGK